MRVLGAMGMPPPAAAFMLAVAGGVAPSFVLPETVGAFAATSQARSGMESYDELLVQVERRTPGFGGMFIDSDGRLVVYLLDTTRLAAARSAIESVFGPNQIPAAGMRAQQGQYSVSQLKEWTDRARGVLRMRGVTMIDLDEAKNRVTIGVDKRSRTPSLRRALSSLMVPRQAVIIQVTDPIRPLKPRSPSPSPGFVL
jgi:hypothetical protein